VSIGRGGALGGWEHWEGGSIGRGGSIGMGGALGGWEHWEGGSIGRVGALYMQLPHKHQVGPIHQLCTLMQ